MNKTRAYCLASIHEEIYTHFPSHAQGQQKLGYNEYWLTVNIGLLWRETGEQLWGRSGNARLTPEVPWPRALRSGAARGWAGMAAPLLQRRCSLRGRASGAFSLGRVICV